MGLDDYSSNLRCAELERAYRAAFARWANHMAQVQAHASDLHSAEAAIAQAAYRHHRDTLWQCMERDATLRATGQKHRCACAPAARAH
jgi:hypothetical protein